MIKLEFISSFFYTQTPMKLHEIAGIGPKTEAKLNALKIFTVEDLLLTVPKSYDDRKIADTVLDTPAYYEATATSLPKIFSVRRNLKRLTFKATILGETIQIALFNQTHWFHHLKPGRSIVVYGVFKKSMTAQRLFLKENFSPGLNPRYKLKTISDKRFREWVRAGFQELKIPESLPKSIQTRFSLKSRHDTLYQAHFPQSLEDIQAFYTWQKIAYLTGRELSRQSVHDHKMSSAKPVAREKVWAQAAALPFSLTKSQKESVQMLLDDLEDPRPKRRLLQGDTGSGKTVVAMLSAIGLLETGHQVALMAPTEILARQHHQTFKTLFKDAYASTILTGSLDAQTLKQRLEAVQAGTVAMVFGTHQLFSKTTRFKTLAQVIIDEQHRFGVNQREALLAKGQAADLISLSATPIPRTLALTLYQDMDVTTLNDVPAGRRTVKTEVVPLKNAKTLDYMIELALEANQQVFVVAPRIEDDEALLSVERIEHYYRDRFPKARLATLHGGQHAEEKTQTLHAFQAHEIDLLIATTVIEVGIDVKDAGLMLIYHAERFGVAQLHQLRGRLGRHHIDGVCYLLYQGNAAVKQRLDVLKTLTDGFELAQMDLDTRGFGTLFGTDQSGFHALDAWPYEETLNLIQAIQATLRDSSDGTSANAL